MKRRQGESTRRTVARWAVGLLFILSGIAVAAVNLVVGYNASQLLAHGSRTSATAEQMTYGKNSDSVEVTFTDADGVEQNSWLDGIPHQVRVSDSLAVVYDQNDPSNVVAVSTAEQESGQDMVYSVLLGAGFAGVGLLTLWRGVPKGIGGWAYNRDYLPGARRRQPPPASSERAADLVD
jgi:hypothetical protein